MKITDMSDCCFHCERNLNKCKKKIKVWKELQSKKYSAARLRTDRTVPKSHGIYCIRTVDGEVLYIGYSNSNVRRRLLAHCGGYDKQAIGKYLKGKDLSGFLLSWVVERKAECLEEQFIEFAKQQQGVRPKFNMKRGRSCRTTEE